MPNRDILPTQLLFLDSLTPFPFPSARRLGVKFSRWTQIVLHAFLKSLKSLQVRILDIYVPHQNEMDISILLCLVLPRQTCSFPKNFVSQLMTIKYYISVHLLKLGLVLR